MVLPMLLVFLTEESMAPQKQPSGTRRQHLIAQQDTDASGA
jgi:hypothetical protein